ncbi:MAG: hypothetical protein WC708_12550 [Lentisphaeria bacterium]
MMAAKNVGPAFLLARNVSRAFLPAFDYWRNAHLKKQFKIEPFSKVPLKGAVRERREFLLNRRAKTTKTMPIPIAIPTPRATDER